MKLEEAIHDEDVKSVGTYSTALNGVTTRMANLGRQLGIGALSRKAIPAFQDRLTDYIKEKEADLVEKEVKSFKKSLDDELG